ncbi:hypothetical protein Tco_1485695 [Tanacetum coccineum]
MEGTVDITEFFKKLKFVCHWADPLWILNGPMLSPYIGITSLLVSCNLQALSNLYYLFSGFMDYLWSCELDISNFGPTDRKILPVESLVVSATNRVSLYPDTSCQNLGRTSNALSIPRRVMTNALTRSGFIRSFRLKASATTFAFPGW